MTDPLAGIVDAVKGPALGDNLKYAQCRQGIVTAIDLVAHTCTVALSADPATIAGVNCLTSYTPAVNDNVYLLKSGTDLWAIGTMVPDTSTPRLGAGVDVNNFCSTTTTSVNATFGTLAGTGVTFSFTKRWSTTNLLVSMSATGFATVATAGIMQVGPNVGGTTWACGSYVFNVLNQRGTAAGTRIATGITAGTYTVSAQVRNQNSTGQVNMNTQDWFSMSCVEIG